MFVTGGASPSPTNIGVRFGNRGEAYVSLPLEGKVPRNEADEVLQTGFADERQRHRPGRGGACSSRKNGRFSEI